MGESPISINWICLHVHMDKFRLQVKYEVLEPNVKNIEIASLPSYKPCLIHKPIAHFKHA